MKTNFIEYYNKREKLNSIFESVILEAQNNPEFLKVLEEAGFWGNLVNAGKQMWQGVRQGAQAAYSQMTGPATQFSNSISALEKAFAQIQKDPNWSKSTTTGSPSIKAMPLSRWLQEIIQELKNQQSQFANKQMPGNIPTQSAQPMTDPSTGKPVDYDPDAVKN